jgi:hypothetical protein
MQDLRSRKTRTAVRTSATIRRRSLIIELHPDRPHELLIREQGRRAASGYWVGFESIYSVGAKQRAMEVRMEKMAAAKKRKEEKRKR